MTFLTLTVAGGAFAGPASSPQPSLAWTRTLPLSSGAITLLMEAGQRSSIVTGLLEDVEKSDVVVYVTDSMPWAAGGAPSYMAFLSHESGTRYLLIRIDRFKISPREQIALLGHELQHALEVAAAPEVRDAHGMAGLYRRIGWEGKRDRFESEAAQKVARQVRTQLSREEL